MPVSQARDGNRSPPFAAPSPIPVSLSRVVADRKQAITLRTHQTLQIVVQWEHPRLPDLMENQNSNWLTSTEAASYLRVEPRTILAWARAGHIKGYILSGTRRITWRFLRSDLDATMHLPTAVLSNGRIQ